MSYLQVSQGKKRILQVRKVIQPAQKQKFSEKKEKMVGFPNNFHLHLNHSLDF